VLDPDINLSDHVPIAIRCRCVCQFASGVAKQLRWDHADLLSYYSTTMYLLYPLCHDLIKFESYSVVGDGRDCHNFGGCI